MTRAPTGFGSIRGRLDKAVREHHVEAIAQQVKGVLQDALRNGLSLPGEVHMSLPDTYGRRLLLRDPEGRYTVGVMTWGPGQGTELPRSRRHLVRRVRRRQTAGVTQYGPSSKGGGTSGFRSRNACRPREVQPAVWFRPSSTTRWRTRAPRIRRSRFTSTAAKWIAVGVEPASNSSTAESRARCPTTTAERLRSDVTTMSLTAGTRLAQYEIVSPVGSGGMGEVYRAATRVSTATLRSR